MLLVCVCNLDSTLCMCACNYCFQQSHGSPPSCLMISSWFLVSFRESTWIHLEQQFARSKQCLTVPQSLNSELKQPDTPGRGQQSRFLRFPQNCDAPRSAWSSPESTVSSYPPFPLLHSNSSNFYNKQKGGMLVFRHLHWPVLGVLTGYILSCSH